MSRAYNNCDDTYSDMSSLGAILDRALKLKQETDMSLHSIVVKQERVTSVATTTFVPPQWMQYAFAGQKINAIRSLRDLTRRDRDGSLLDLGQCKDIVETICNSLKTTTEQV